MFRGTQEPLQEDCIFAYRTVTFYGWPFQTIRLMLSYPVWLLPHPSPASGFRLRPANGGGVNVALQPQALLANRLVWAGPISLATTLGISVDLFSSGY